MKNLNTTSVNFILPSEQPLELGSSDGFECGFGKCKTPNPHPTLSVVIPTIFLIVISPKSGTRFIISYNKDLKNVNNI
jgi:hypothetical protein